ncbi:MAG TPA: response regulator transcription factor [Streptosporangiaceae bacterium]|nr:response regulator transcription factor [Streptosporangiaceae bacterium]
MRLVLCDDNRIMCEALAAAMQGWGHRVVAITAAAQECLAALSEHQPDAVILEPLVSAGAELLAGTPEGEAAGRLSVAAAIRARYPDTALLILSSFVNRATWSAAIRMGVAGYLCKDRNIGQIAASLETIAAGGVSFDPAVLSQASPEPTRRRNDRPLYQLTPREREVLRRLVAGQGTKQMAREMSVTIDTLRGYVKNVLAKLGAHSRLQAAAVAAREDLCGELTA